MIKKKPLLNCLLSQTKWALVSEQEGVLVEEYDV